MLLSWYAYGRCERQTVNQADVNHFQRQYEPPKIIFKNT